MVAPYRHARLTAMKLAGDPNDLEVVPKPDARIANQPVSGVDQSANGE
jgi:hypothetical protein